MASPPLEKLAAAFQRESGHIIKFTVGSDAGLRKQVGSGTPADVVVLSSDEAAELEERQALVASRVEVGSRWLAVGVTPGMARPRIGTAEELRETLIAAKSITYGGGHAGVHFSKVVLTRLGTLALDIAPTTPAELRKLVDNDLKLWRDVVARSGERF